MNSNTTLSGLLAVLVLVVLFVGFAVFTSDMHDVLDPNSTIPLFGRIAMTFVCMTLTAMVLVPVYYWVVDELVDDCLLTIGTATGYFYPYRNESGLSTLSTQGLTGGWYVRVGGNVTEYCYCATGYAADRLCVLPGVIKDNGKALCFPTQRAARIFMNATAEGRTLRHCHILGLALAACFNR